MKAYNRLGLERIPSPSSYRRSHGICNTLHNRKMKYAFLTICSLGLASAAPAGGKVSSSPLKGRSDIDFHPSRLVLPPTDADSHDLQLQRSDNERDLGGASLQECWRPRQFPDLERCRGNPAAYGETRYLTRAKELASLTPNTVPPEQSSQHLLHKRELPQGIRP